MNDNKALFLNEIIKTSNDIWEKGWAERNAGNISVRLAPEDLEHSGNFDFSAKWQQLNNRLPNLKGEFFLVSGTGKYIRNIQISPEKNLGIIEIDQTGEKFRVVWGYSDGGKPTSELSAHLKAHSVRKDLTNGLDRVVLHTHPTNVIALTYALDFDTYSLSKLLWEMHAECVVVFPEGVEFLPWMMAGSKEISDATAESFKKRSMVVWQFHGIFAVGQDLDTAFGLIDTAEKSAEIYLKVAQAGGVKNRLTLDRIDSIARNYGQIPAPDIMEYLKKMDEDK